MKVFDLDTGQVVKVRGWTCTSCGEPAERGVRWTFSGTTRVWCSDCVIAEVNEVAFLTEQAEKRP